MNLEEYRITFSEDDVESSFNYMLSRLKVLWSSVKLSKLQKIFKQDKRLSNKFKSSLESTDTLEKVLDTLSKSPFCTWLEIQILNCMAEFAGIAGAIRLLSNFEKCIYCKKYFEVVKDFKQQYIISEHLTLVYMKLNKNAEHVIVADLIKYCQSLESILNLAKLSALVGSKTGCLEVSLLIPKDYCSRAYESMRDNFLKLRSLSIRYIQIGIYHKFYVTNLMKRSKIESCLTENSPSDDYCKFINYVYAYCMYVYVNIYIT